MHSIIRFITIILLTLSFQFSAFGQQPDRMKGMENMLNELAKTSPGLEQNIEISVNGVSIQEFIRGIALSNGLNITIDPNLNISIVNNFTDISVKNVLLFLCKRYELDITMIGNIISIIKYNAPPENIVKPLARKINLYYDGSTDKLSYDLKNDSLYNVAKELTKLSGKNIIISPGLESKLLSGYIQSMPFANAMEKLALANDLKVIKTDDQCYVMDKKEPKNVTANDNKNTNDKKTDGKKADDSWQWGVDSLNKIVSVVANDVPIRDVVTTISSKLGVNYFLYSDLKGNTTLKLMNATYDDFLKNLFINTTYTFHHDSLVYYIGERQNEGLRNLKTIQLHYRSVEKISELIPADIKKNVEIKESIELNSLILCGSAPAIVTIENFVREIDKVIPVIQIEVIIIDYKTGHTVSTGIKAGLGTQPTTTSGSVYPGVNMELGAGSINSLINSFNGFGWVKLGKVTPNFYLSIKALEDDGIIKVNSTPKLATLNGHEAKLSIGNTEYYLEEQNTVVGSQNPQNITTRQYRPINAAFQLTVKPVVSGDDQITLEIDVQQSDFTGRISQYAPPGSVSRNFSSLIRVKNEEMVLLGGLEKKSNSTTVSGLPLLARIPVIKWFFSNITKEKSNSRLSIFIKPTIIY
ncbi:MAG: type II and III secretion system protein [Bacteroidota bacterium]